MLFTDCRFGFAFNYLTTFTRLLFIRSSSFILVFFRLFFTIWFAVVVHWTPSFKLEDGTYPYSYFVFILVTYCMHQVYTQTFQFRLLSLNVLNMCYY